MLGKQKMKRNKILIIIGNKYSKLKVLRRIEDKYDSRYFECLCDCGNLTGATASQLAKFIKKSCGCSTHEEQVNRGLRLKKGMAGFTKVKASYSKHARYRKLSFHLNDEQLIKLFTSNCYYCNSEPNCISNSKSKNVVLKEHSTFMYNGIDRLDNLKGYEIDNCVSCCFNCNVGKHILTQIEYVDHIKKTYNNLIEKKLI